MEVESGAAGITEENMSNMRDIKDDHGSVNQSTEAALDSLTEQLDGIKSKGGEVVQSSEMFDSMTKENKQTRDKVDQLSKDVNTLVAALKEKSSDPEPTQVKTDMSDFETLFENKDPEDHISGKEAMAMLQSMKAHSDAEIQKVRDQYESNESQKAVTEKKLFESGQWDKIKDNPIAEGSFTTLAMEHANIKKNGTYLEREAFAKKHFVDDHDDHEDHSHPLGVGGGNSGGSSIMDKISAAYQSANEISKTNNPQDVAKAEQIIKSLNTMKEKMENQGR